jgi:hypothetical protein
MARSLTLRRSCALLTSVVAVSLVLADRSSGAPFEAFIPPKYKDIILAAPVPRYPHVIYYQPGRFGLYRIKVNQQTGAVDVVNVLKRPAHGVGVGDANAAVILALFKWKFKPGSIKQLDFPVQFDPYEIRPELKNAAIQ